MTSRRLRAEAITDGCILLAARGKTAVDIADALNVNERTVRRRLAQEEIQARVRAARSELLDQARGQFAALVPEAIRSLDWLLVSEEPGTRLAAVRVALAEGARFTVDDSMTARLDALSVDLKEIKATLEALESESDGAP